MFENKKILLIGGTGSIGQALAKKILGKNPEILRIYSRDEYKQFLMQQEFSEYKNIRYLIGDVRDKERLERAMNDIDIVFNLAALKHVPVCEYDPFEAVKTNVIGTQNVIECAIKNQIKKVIYTSSDKAVSPTNTMGATKLLAERLISSADFAKGNEIPVFSAVRFGNVLGTRGSVIPLWQKQIREQGLITITEPEMTRFMMSIDQAVNLLLKACEISKGGEVFVLKMPVVKLQDLSEVIINYECNKNSIDKNKVEVKIIGLRPGEKLYEELMTIHESNDAIEFDDMFAIIPHHNLHRIEGYGVKKSKISEYSSDNSSLLTINEIKELLRSSKFLG